MIGTDERFLRFEELDAGRALGDLDAAEMAEWAALSQELGLQGATGLDRVAAALEIGGAEHAKIAMPPGLAEKLRAGISTSADPAPAAVSPISNFEPSPRRTSSIFPWLGWAIAACLLAFLVASKLVSSRPTDPAGRRSELLQEAPDSMRLPLAGAGETYAAAGGEVVWSDSRQEGYLTLENLPANDPTRNQYQLWIVDPDRDEFPIDGGVFDIAVGGGPVVIPIQAKLVVENPAAFVITLEQPGGVVRSKQEVVVALAKS